MNYEHHNTPGLFFILLTLCIDAVSKIQGASEVFLREGGAINLTCSVTGHVRNMQQLTQSNAWKENN